MERPAMMMRAPAGMMQEYMKVNQMI